MPVKTVENYLLGPALHCKCFANRDLVGETNSFILDAKTLQKTRKKAQWSAEQPENDLEFIERSLSIREPSKKLLFSTFEERQSKT